MKVKRIPHHLALVLIVVSLQQHHHHVASFGIASLLPFRRKRSNTATTPSLFPSLTKTATIARNSPVLKHMIMQSNSVLLQEPRSKQKSHLFLAMFQRRNVSRSTPFARQLSTSIPLGSTNREDNDDNGNDPFWTNPLTNDNDETTTLGKSNDNTSNEYATNPEQRRRLRDWMYHSGGRSSSPLVQPVQWEDELPTDRKETMNTTPKFGNLFAGMPKLNEILLGNKNFDNNDDAPATDKTPQSSFSADSLTRSKTTSTSSSPATIKKTVDDEDKKEDPAWFVEEKRMIEQQYERVRQEMLKQLELGRSKDPNSIPANAVAVLDAVLKQELQLELRHTKERRQIERYQAYEQDLIQRNRDTDKEMTKSPNSTMFNDAIVQELMNKTKEEYARSDKIQQRVDDYYAYERAVQESYNENLEKLLSSGSVDNDKAVPPIKDLDRWALDRLRSLVDDDSTDNDEASEMIKDILRENLDDLTERMNRTPSTPLLDQSMKEWQMYRAIASRMADEKGDDDSNHFDETEILRRMESWREYVTKEEYLRQRSGLSDESPTAQTDADKTLVEANTATLSPQGRKELMIESRKTLNRMSIDALENLLSTTYVSRRKRLQDEIKFLKATLEENDYMDVDESTLLDTQEDLPTFDTNTPVDTSQLFNAYEEDESKSPKQQLPVPQNMLTRLDDPNWFSDNQKTQSDHDDIPTRTPGPPKTPFFTDAVSTEPSRSLGSMEDQKLEAMYRRAGATTIEEQESIRKSYEEFKQLEEERRQLSGLSDDYGRATLIPKAKYNISAVMKEDGDFDAEAVLSAIGPRPTRTKRDKTTKPDVADSLYRAVSAVGGGKYKDDPEMDAKQKASFLEYVEKEALARGILDDSEETLTSGIVVDKPISLDDEEYAEDVIAALGERPRPRRGRFLSAEELSDRGGVRPGVTDDDTEDDEEDDDEEFELGLVPDWLRKENSAMRKTMRGNDVEESFDDSYYERNARQVAEFERRRRGMGKTMGIDISDVLGRSNLKSDDYADYKFDDDYTRTSQTDWGSYSFQARKQTLLEYIELDLQEVNSLMDHKNSVYATGVSQYLPRINKPFVEFGAIFRLESVLVETTGLHVSAWKQLANENNFPVPTISDIQKAALVKADEAVRDIFFWSNDVRLCRQLAARHRELFQSSFEQWMVDNQIRPADYAENQPVSDNVGAERISKISVAPQSSRRKLTEREFLDKAMAEWSEVADRIGEDPPSEEEIAIAFSVGTEIAVKEIFGWASDMKQVDQIIEIFNEVSGISKASDAMQSPSIPTRKSLTQEAAMEIHYRAWLAAAEKFHLRSPTEDEVLAAFVINDEEVAANGFGWDGGSVKDAIAYFKLQVKQGLESHGVSLLQTAVPIETITENAAPAFSSNEFDTQMKVWSAVASKENFASPDNDEILFAMAVGLDDAIMNGFGWANQPDEVRRLVELYYKEMEKETRLPVTRLPPIARLEIGEEANMEEIFRSVYHSWTATAQKLGYDDPTMEEIQFAMTVGLEEAIMFGMQWTQDRKEIQKIVEVYRDELSQRRSLWSIRSTPIPSTSTEEENVKVTLKPGAAKLTKSLKDAEMPSCVVSNLDQHQMDLLLNYFGLADLFPHRISANNGYTTRKDQLLGAALRLERRPDHCVVFDAVPESGASEVSMRSVNLVHPYPRYELVSSDTTAGSLDDLTPINIRRLFAERISDQTQVDVQQPQEQIQRKTMTTFYYDDD